MNFIKPYYTNSTGKKSDNIIYLSDKNFSDKQLEEYENLYQHFLPLKEELEKAKIKYKTPNKRYYYLHRERNENFFLKGSKIICQVRCHKPSFLYTEKEYYASRALNIIKTDRINLKYLALLFNSNSNFFYFKNRGSMQGNMLKFDKGSLIKVPIYYPVKTDNFIVLSDYMKYLNNPNNKDILSHTENERIASHIEYVIDMMVYELYFEDHMKEKGLDVLQFVNPQPIENMDEAKKTEIIKDFYMWYQKPENEVRQRILLIETRSKDTLAVIRKSVN